MSSDNCQQAACDGKVYKSGYCVEHFVQYGQAAEASTPTAASATSPTSASASGSGSKPAPSPQGSGKFAKFGGGGNKCTICEKTSYPAETIQYDMKPYHKDCFKCTTCRKELDAPNAAQFESKIYCKMCFQKGGYNRKQAEVKWEAKEGVSSSATPSKFGGGGHPCTTCGKTVYAGETVQFEGRIYHPKCLLCKDCGKDCHVNEAAQFEGNVYCKRCWEKGRYNKKQVATAQNFNADKPKTQVSSRFANLGGGGNKCYTCQQTVYPAETVQYEQRPYHSKCFKCLNCNKEILQVAQAEHKGDKVYCSKCFHELGLWQATLTEKA